jgi:hypothetical protein
MASGSSLPGPALSASRAALNSALNDSDLKAASQPPPLDTNGANGVVLEEPEEGEIQELDLAAHAEEIRTVFSDPTNFNVKVRLPLSLPRSLPPSPNLAPSLFLLDLVVRLARHQRSQPPPDTIHLHSRHTTAPNTLILKRCRTGLDGGHQKGHQLRQRRRVLGASVAHLSWPTTRLTSITQVI